MNLKKAFVFDNQHYFYSFLKKNFKNLDFTEARNGNPFLDVNEENTVVVFVIYSEEDIFDLFRLYTHGLPIVVITSHFRIIKKLEGIVNLILVDSLKTKPELKRNIQYSFDEYFNNKQMN